MTSAQQAALSALAEVVELSPEVRLGQLIAHLGFLGDAHLGKGLGDIEDDELIAVLYRHRTELQARALGTASPALPPVGPAVSVSGSPSIPTTHVGG